MACCLSRGSDPVREKSERVYEARADPQKTSKKTANGVEEERMSGWRTRLLATALVSVIGSSLVAEPAKAAFYNYDGPTGGTSIADTFGNSWTLFNTGTCYYYRDNNLGGDAWAVTIASIGGGMYYFYYDVNGTAVYPVFGAIRNVRTGLVWDGGIDFMTFFLDGYFRGVASPSCF